MEVQSEKSIKIIYGEDWKKVTVENELIDNLKEMSKDSEIDDKQKIIDGYKLYFKSYYDMPQDNGHSPFNLGVYYSEKDKHLRSSQYVGIMPLIDNESFKLNNDKFYIAIHPRFKASAVNMLEYILKSDDFYENNEAIIFKDFEIKELFNNPEQFNEKENKILFGLIKDLKEIDIESLENKDKNLESLVNNITIFEIWDFLSKAHTVCQKMLKHQSEKVEENFVGKVKGKINLQKQIKKNMALGRIDRTYCVYNKLTIDNTENRILKYALYLCECAMRDLSGIDILNENLAYCKRALSSARLVKCTPSDFRGIKNNGVYRHYKPAIESALKVIKRISVSFMGDDSEKKTTISKNMKPFFIDMNVLFELYCRALVGNAIKGSKYNLELVEYGKSYRVLGSNVNGFIDKLIPDIVITEDDNPIMVIDAKYSSLGSYNRERTHQIMAYMLLLNCNYGGFISPVDNNRKEDKEEYQKRQNDDKVIQDEKQNNEGKDIDYRKMISGAQVQETGKYGFHIGISTSEVGSGEKEIMKFIEEICKK